MAVVPSPSRTMAGSDPRVSSVAPPQHQDPHTTAKTSNRVYIMSSSSSSNSPSSLAVASWYCWYSETRSFMFDSASVNSISSMPSPVYQWRNALRRNMEVNCSATRFHDSWMAVVLPTKVVDILRPLGGMSQMEDLTLLGIHSTPC